MKGDQVLRVMGVVLFGAVGAVGLSAARPEGCCGIQTALMGQGDPPCSVGEFSHCEIQNVPDPCGKLPNGSHLRECAKFTPQSGEVAWVMCGHPPGVGGPWVQIGQPDAEGRCCYVKWNVRGEAQWSTDGTYINNCNGNQCVPSEGPPCA